MLGLGRTGDAVCRWLTDQGVRVYASDSDDREELHAVAARLRTRAVCVELGAHDLDRITRAAAVVVSPGIPPDIPVLIAARDAGVEIVAELDLAARALVDAKLIVVTGTNGKTTTTALIAHLLTTAGIDAEAAGNIGRPLIAVAARPSLPEWVVAEASSFQLHDSPHLKPSIGVLTNLAADHLNRYRTLAEYYADKRCLFQNASDQSVWILNGDDAAVRDLAEGVPGRRCWWSLDRPVDAWLDRSTNALVLDGETLLPRAGLPLLGDHNVENALAAVLAADAAGVSRQALAAGLGSFRPPPHRLEPIRETNGVLWINDSKATNVASASAALRAMDRPYIWLAGGRGKGELFAPLAPDLAGRCRRVIAFGETAVVLAAALRDTVPVEVVATLHHAVARARALADAGDAVLLSPACASFDQFRHFEHRGDEFRQLVQQL